MLLDKSQSMTLQDRRLTPTDQMRVALAFGKVPPTAAITGSVPADVPKDPSRQTLVLEALKNPQMNLIPGLKKVGPIRTVLFGSDIREEEPAKILNRATRRRTTRRPSPTRSSRCSARRTRKLRPPS